MSAIVIAVGSTRKPKLAAVREAVDALAGLLRSGTAIEIVGAEVESGVNHTPLSREECMRGARQRAETLIQIARRDGKTWNYFVGLEGGLDSVIESGTDERGPTETAPNERGKPRIFLESWAYVSDGQRGYFGRSGAVELPEELAHDVFEKGIELGVAIDRFAGQAGIRDAQGAWGVLSANRITRQEAFRVALIAAFAPFYNEVAYKHTAAAG